MLAITRALHSTRVKRYKGTGAVAVAQLELAGYTHLAACTIKPAAARAARGAARMRGARTEKKGTRAAEATRRRRLASMGGPFPR